MHSIAGCVPPALVATTRCKSRGVSVEREFLSRGRGSLSRREIPPLMDRMTNRCKNITFQQLRNKEVVIKKWAMLLSTPGEID